MQRPRPLPLVLGSIAFAGWVLFVLACTGWPGWSPDGKQVAFPYRDQKVDATGVAIFDREQKTVTTLYLGQTDDLLATAQWSQDGKQILLYQMFGDDDRYAMEVLSIPVKEKYPIRSLGVTSKTMGDWPPLVEVKGTVYVALNGITALDLATWHTQQQPVDNHSLILFAMGDHVLYIAGPKKPATLDTSQPPGTQQPAEKAETAKEVPPKSYEFGELDQRNLSRHAWFTVTERQISEFAQCSGADLGRNPAVNAGTGRMAFTAFCEDKPDAILIFDRSGMKQVMRPKAESNFQLTNPQLAQDGKTLYAGMYVPGPGQEKGHYGIAEIALDTQAVRLTPITRLDVSSSDYRDGMRVSLAPDGSMLATSTALLRSEGDIDREDVALYILDLRDPQRGVTKVHPPNWEPKTAEPAPAAEKKTP